MAQHTKTFYVSKDTFVDADLYGRNDYVSDINYGNLNYVRFDETFYPNEFPRGKSAMLGFDFSELRYKKIATNPTLRVKRKSYKSENFYIDVKTGNITVNWDETTVTGRMVNGKSNVVRESQFIPKSEEMWDSIDLYTLLNNMQRTDGEDKTNYMKNGLFIQWWSYGGGYYEFYSKEDGNPAYVTVTYEDAPPLQPIVFEPNSNYVNNVEEVTFKWKYKTEVWDTQAGFELQWKHELGSWTTVSRTTTSEFYVMPSNTLPSGRIEWKVRTKNQFNEWSPWSEVLTFHAIGLPTAPIVSITQQGARPIVTWVANLQQVYQVQILDNNNKIVYDSGSVPSISNRSHKVIAFLENGTYTARVRIKNEFDLFSNWGTKEFKIETNKPNPPNLNIYHINDGLMVRIDETFSDYLLIFRAEKDSEDYKCIAKTNEYEYRDYSVKGDIEYKYFVRVVLDETFVDSQKVMAKAYLKYSTLAPTSNLADYMQLKSNLNSRPEKNMSLSNLSTKQHYTGRQFPVTDYTAFKNNVYTFAFYLKENELYKFIEIYNRKETVLYRDKKISVFGDIDEGLDIGVTDLDGYSVKFTITEADYEGGNCLD